MPASDIMTIAQSGEAILNRPTQTVITFDQALVQLSDNMIATMTAANGVGIAAPQVFSDLAIFIMHSRPNERYPNAPETSATVVINPQIIACSEEMELGMEGCLSIAGRRVEVLRHKTVNVQYQNIHGDVIQQQLTDFVARIFQHEFDHLQGITLLERIHMANQSPSAVQIVTSQGFIPNDSQHFKVLADE
ncbi:peptide deformylase [uncultured Shewanella sp.]|uniref:peptide deformylase n=1 Tax=uncultured Shewanella sp. TaxID=173975 RepID=UPI0026230491|nr:peptide deformylase [uncultured Shewanella sp.]